MEIEPPRSLGALGVVSFDSTTLKSLVGSSPRSLGVGVGVGGFEESKGSDRGSIAPGYYSGNIPLQGLGARRSIGWEVVNKMETGVVQRQGGQESRKSV